MVLQRFHENCGEHVVQQSVQFTCKLLSIMLFFLNNNILEKNIGLRYFDINNAEDSGHVTAQGKKE